MDEPRRVSKQTQDHPTTVMTKSITIVAIDYQHHELTKFAIEQTMKCVDVKDVLTISDKEILPGAGLIQTNPVHDMTQYNLIMLKGIADLIETDHALYVQWDGMANKPDRWTDDFLKYDYIGAPWPNEPQGRDVGNGGFSLRSRKLLNACLDPEVVLLPEHNFAQEDASIGRNFRPLLEQRYDIKFAPTHVASHFSYELGFYNNSFGFHGIWNVLGFGKRETAELYCRELKWTGWNFHYWHHIINALFQRKHMDLVELAVDKLKANQPELLPDIVELVSKHQLSRKDELLAILQK